MKIFFANITLIFEKFLLLLKVHRKVGGLDVSDQVIRFSYYDGKLWRFFAVQCAPGVLENGKIKNRAEFIKTLLELKLQILGGKAKKGSIDVVMSFSSASTYNQVFNLPLLEGDEFEKAVGFNVQMTSPVDISETYFGWEIVARDEAAGRYDILSVFIDRVLVDEMVAALFEAGFIPTAVESKALVLARMVREKGQEIDKTKSCVLVNIDNAGIDFLVLRKGELYFEYASPWHDVMDKKGQISMDVFSAIVAKNINQVINFYGQHWQDQISGIFISSGVLYDETKNAISTSTSIPVAPLHILGFNNQETPPEWLVALGCGIRGLEFKKRKNEISLLNSGAEKTFVKTQLIDFMDFWRILVPVALCFVVIMLAGVDIFLMRMQDASSGSAVVTPAAGNSTEVTLALTSVNDFNRSVAFIQDIEKKASPEVSIITELGSIASSTGISIANASFRIENKFITLNAIAPSQDQISSFEKSIHGNSKFTNVNLPLSSIQKQPSGSNFSFSMTLIAAK